MSISERFPETLLRLTCLASRNFSLGWHRKLPLRDMNKFFLPLLSLVETDYKSDDYGRDSGY